MARWATLGVEAVAALLGAFLLHVPVRWGVVAVVLGATAASNVLLARSRNASPGGVDVAAVLIAADTVGLAVVLAAAGGPLNPATIYFLVLITQAAFVHGARVATLVAVLSTALHGLLFVVMTPELRAALAMHQEVASHFQGMWFAFAMTAALVTVFVARLATAVVQRDAELRTLEAKLARTESLSRLATLAADTAHELGTPLGTIALTAGELERTLARRADTRAEDLEDARLIRDEAHRCRGLLDGLAARAGQPVGSTPVWAAVGDAIREAIAELPPHRAAALRVEGDDHTTVRWPVPAVGRALLNVLRNAFDASPAGAFVVLRVGAAPEGVVFEVLDEGPGVPVEMAARVGEPFFTTKGTAGLGLGVLVARSTLEALGGRLDFEPRRPHGNCVRMIVPREPQA